MVYRAAATCRLTAASSPAAQNGFCLVFLPPDAQDRLLDNVTALGAPGSRFASEHMPDSGGFEAVEPRMREQGFDLDVTELMYPGRAPRCRRVPVPARVADGGGKHRGVVRGQWACTAER